MNYYNEIDKDAVQWLRNLIEAGKIPNGVIDERSIEDVKPDELAEFKQCHFFAGIGGWSLALKYAGWPEDRPVWTGSCPCQPFSIAGKGLGKKDSRHLWPEFLRLISERKPSTVFGEQVAGAAGREWLAGVRADLEAMGYAVGAADLCAAGVGAPHIRQRLWWVADGAMRGHITRKHQIEDNAKQTITCNREKQGMRRPFVSDGLDGSYGGMEKPFRFGRGRRHVSIPEREAGQTEIARSCGVGAWDDTILIPFTDGKTRRIKSGIMPLVTRISGHVGQIRAYGNSIVPQVAAEFIKTCMEVNNANPR